MIKIKKAYSSFLKDIHVGVRAYIIELSEFGYEDEIENVATASASFPYVLIKGEEPFKQNNSISDLCKNIQSLNPYTNIIIYTDGMIRPKNMNSIKHVEYIIFAKTKDKSIPYSERIDEVIWKWLCKAGGKFIFDVSNEDDFDEINIIISGLLIRKNQVYINIIDGDYNELSFIACHNGYNLYISFDGEWFEDEN